MQIDPSITAIEQRATAAGIKMASVHRRAQTAATTWQRWKNGSTEPRLATLRKVETALEELISEARQRMDRLEVRA